MNEEKVDRMLAELSCREKPPAPDLRSRVCREIGRRRARPTFRQRLLPILSWSEMLLQPRIAACALGIALATGAIPGVWSLTPARPGTEAEYARKSLHLDVFEAVKILSLKPSATGASSR
jgi:hypothetical protein